MQKLNSSLLTMVLARKGSKRLKNKNLRILNKLSLSEITIKFAMKLKKYSNIILSTDDKRIIELGKKYKVINPGLRPDYLSRDNSSSLKVIKYLVRWYHKKYKNKIKGIILLQPTSPYRSLKKIIKMIKIFNYNKCKINYVSVSNTKKKNNMYLNKKNFLKLPSKINKANCYINGNFYILNVEKINSNTIETIINSKTKGIMIKSKKMSLDIDTLENLKEARNYIS